jgi:hypothetical protein
MGLVHRLLFCTICIYWLGCGFTNEPDPGAMTNSHNGPDGVGQGNNPDAGVFGQVGGGGGSGVGGSGGGGGSGDEDAVDTGQVTLDATVRGETSRDSGCDREPGDSTVDGGLSDAGVSSDTGREPSPCSDAFPGDSWDASPPTEDATIEP